IVTRLPKIPTGFPFKPVAASASPTVAPSGRRISTTSAPLARARTTSMRSAMDLVCAAGKGVDHGVGDVLENRLQQRSERAGGEFELHREFDLARLLAERPEAPGGGEVAK